MPALYCYPFPFLQRGFPFFLHPRIELDSPAHVGIHQHAVDFLVPEGTPVSAPRDGVVIALKDDSDRGGPDESFAADGNYILIDHTSGSFACVGYSRRVYDEEELGGGFNPMIDPGEGQYSILAHLARGSTGSRSATLFGQDRSSLVKDRPAGLTNPTSTLPSTGTEPASRSASSERGADAHRLPHPKRPTITGRSTGAASSFSETCLRGRKLSKLLPPPSIHRIIGSN